MLNVITIEEAIEIIAQTQGDGSPVSTQENRPSVLSVGRVLHEDIIATEDIPGFNRSTVDGYAVISSDTFGCSESTEALLTLKGEVLMGQSADISLIKGACAVVSTGGELPSGADAVVMLEHTEDYGNDMIGIQKPVAPGNNVIFKGDDVKAGESVLTSGTILKPHDIGILSALGHSEVTVRAKPKVAIISTGDELVEVTETPKRGQIRDVNTPMLISAVTTYGAQAQSLGIIKDDEAAIRAAVKQAIKESDIVLISGGSSAGTRDLTARIIEAEGELIFHGIAMKPGKPTIFGKIYGKPIIGLPGHPVAAYFVTHLIIRPLIANYLGAKLKDITTTAKISESISSNHGRTEYIPVKLENDVAIPIKSKSSLITSLADIDGYISIPRDSEGLAKGEEVKVDFI